MAIALNTARESIRSKVLGSLLFFSGLAILSSFVLGEMSLHNERRIINDTLLFFSTIFSAVIATYVSITTFYNEFEKKTVYTILSKPIARWQFLLGKYLGVQGLMLGITGSMLLLSCAIIKIQSLPIEINLIFSFTTLFLQTCIITAVAHLLVVVASPLLAGMATISIFIGGNLLTQLKTIKKLLQAQENPLSIAVHILEYVLPNLESLNLSRELIYQIKINADYIMQGTLYTLTYTIATLALATIIFNQKDIV